MRRVVFLLLVVLVCFVPAAVLAQEGAGPAVVPGDASPAPAGASPAGSDPWGGTVEPVPPEEFAEKVVDLVVDVRRGLGELLEPLAGLSLVVCAGILIAGVALGWHAAKRAAVGGIILCAFGLLVYWLGPVLLGVVRSLAERLSP